MTNLELIKSYAIFHAFFCEFLESDSLGLNEEFCEISWKLEKEIRRRKISQLEIEDCIKSAIFDPQDLLMINKYIFPDLISSEIGSS